MYLLKLFYVVTQLRYNEAEEAATTALQYDPKMIKARYRRGIARKEQNYLKAAITGE